MLVIGQGIEDRDARLGRQFRHDRMVERPDHDPVNPAVEVVSYVRDALPYAETDAIPEVKGVPTELVQPGLERDPRAQALLLEDQRDIASAERLCHVPPRLAEFALQLGSGREHPLVVAARQIGRTKKVAALQCCAHVAILYRRSASHAQAVATKPLC